MTPKSAEIGRLRIAETHPTPPTGTGAPVKPREVATGVDTNFEIAARHHIGSSLGVNKGFPYF